MNTINNKLVRNAFGIALGLCVAAVPGYCATDQTFLSFSGGSATGGNVNVSFNNGTESLTSLSAFSAPYDTSLIISGSTSPDQADIGTWSLTNTSMSVSLSGGVYTFSLSGDYHLFWLRWQVRFGGL